MKDCMVSKYKCRLCGEVFDGAASSNELIQEVAVVLTLRDHDQGIRRIITHHCKHNNSIGLADLLGFIPEK